MCFWMVNFSTTVTSITCFCPCSLPTELSSRHSFPGIPEVWEQVQRGNWGKVPLCRFNKDATSRNSRICWRLHKGLDYGWGVLHHSPPGTMTWIDQKVCVSDFGQISITIWFLDHTTSCFPFNMWVILIRNWVKKKFIIQNWMRFWHPSGGYVLLSHGMTNHRTTSWHLSVTLMESW